MKYFLLLLLFSGPLVAQEIDRSVSSFEVRQKKRVDRFDFSGLWPNMETIDIDAKRKKSIELDLSGQYPLLENIYFEGSFGTLKANLTGEFPKVSLINFLCGSCRMNLDFTSKWLQSCEINVRGAKEDVVLILPTNVGLVVKTKVGPKGKVIVGEGLKKKGFGILKKNYQNPLAESAAIVLHINVETSDGNIHLSTIEE